MLGRPAIDVEREAAAADSAAAEREERVGAGRRCVPLSGVMLTARAVQGQAAGSKGHVSRWRCRSRFPGRARAASRCPGSAPCRIGEGQGADRAVDEVDRARLAVAVPLAMVTGPAMVPVPLRMAPPLMATAPLPTLPSTVRLPPLTVTPPLPTVPPALTVMAARCGR